MDDAVDYDDPATPDVTLAYDDNGRRTSMVDGTGTTTYTWDSLNRLTASTNGAGDAVSYAYNLRNLPTTITYPGNDVVTRAYDDAGRLTTVTDWLTNATAFAYDADSNLTTITYPNGVVTTQDYDDAGRLTDVSHDDGPTTVASFAYTRDDVGNLTATTPTGVPGGAEAYSYTALDQLKAVNTDTYAYDPADDLVQMETGTLLAYDAANQLASATTATTTTAFTYDLRGNRTRATTTTPPGALVTIDLAYDQANRLTDYGTSADYAYDGDGLRMAKTVGATTTEFTWNTAGGLPLLLQEAAGSDAMRYIHGPGGRIIEPAWV